MPERAPLHRAVGFLSSADRRKAYDAARPSSSRIYGHQWRRLRLMYLRAHPICECEEACGRPATVVDHRIPHHGDHGLMYAWANLQSMTKACHDKKTAARDGGFGNPIR